MKNQNGQSLVEFVIVTPLFFIILAGILSLFYLQNRNYMDSEAKISVRLSQFLYEKEERTSANWEQAKNESTISLKNILYNSFNPSSAFYRATDKKDGVFIDKNVISYTENRNCLTKNTYAFSLKEFGRFQMSTCADKNGYEKVGFDFPKVLDDFLLSHTHYEQSSLYYPSQEMAWPNRANLATHAAQEFTLSSLGNSFANNYASLTFPIDNSFFNGKCYMEPYHPQCILSPYFGKIKRASYDGANVQLFACYAEMIAMCASAGLVAPVCIAEGTEQIKISIQLGKSAPNCPFVNTEIEAAFILLKEKILADASLNMMKEENLRKKLF